MPKEHENFFDHYFLQTAWEKYAPDLTVVLSDREWSDVDRVYEVFLLLRSMVLIYEPGQAIDEDILRKIPAAAKRAGKLSEQLV